MHYELLRTDTHVFARSATSEGSPVLFRIRLAVTTPSGQLAGSDIQGIRLMRTPALAKMSVDTLLSMRDAIEHQLTSRVAEMKRQLKSLLGSKAPPPKPGRRGPMKGGKVKPKYRGPNGETWAGRGMQPKWLTKLIGQGRDKEEFAVASAIARKKPAPNTAKRAKNKK